MAVLVTGGSGFVGGRLTQFLLHAASNPLYDDFPIFKQINEVRVLDVRPPDFLFDTTPTAKATFFQGSIMDPELAARAAAGCIAAFHCAGVVDWGHRTYKQLHLINVEGTEVIMAACRAAGVKYFVFTSTMDVVLRAGADTINTDEDTLSYPDQFLYGHYARSKAVAERLVLAADSDSFHTVAVRPCGVYGERDPWHLPNIIQSATSGQLVFRLGAPKTVFQHVYVDNVVHGHMCALGSLAKPFAKDESKRVNGQAFIITDAPAENFWEFVTPVVTACGKAMPPATRVFPTVLILFIAHVLRFIAFILSLVGIDFRPTLTPLAVGGMVYSQSFSGSKARARLGYRPIVTHEQGKARTLAHFFPTAAAGSAKTKQHAT